MLIKTYRELAVYKNAMEAALEIFEVTKNFPRGERYNLTDQILRSSRSVCANLAEAWRKRRYPAAFIAKLSDAESEAAETQVWAEFALRCHYLNQSTFEQLDQRYEKVLSQIVRMIDQPEKWVIRPRIEPHA